MPEETAAPGGGCDSWCGAEPKQVDQHEEQTSSKAEPALAPDVNEDGSPASSEKTQKAHHHQALTPQMHTLAENMGCGSAADGAETVVEAIEDKVDEIKEAIHDRLEDAKEGLMDMAMDTFGPTASKYMGDGVDKVLVWMGPTVGNKVTDTAAERWPNAKKLDAENGEEPSPFRTNAVSYACSAVMAMKDWIMDFCKDLGHLLMKGLQAAQALVATVSKVCCAIYKTLREGVTACVNAVKAGLNDCCEVCIGCCINLKEFIEDCYNKLATTVEDFIKSSLGSAGLPQFIIDKVDWDNLKPDNAGEPLERVEGPVEGVKAPEQKAMGDA